MMSEHYDISFLATNRHSSVRVNEVVANLGRYTTHSIKSTAIGLYVSHESDVRILTLS
jgi:hypothetical protein